jgi:Tfp pilus assembly protein PilN
VEKSRAQVVQRLQDQINEANLGMNFLAQLKQSPLLVKILAEATRVLPDNTWLVEFELQGHELRLHGYSGSASSLIAVFDNSQFFTNAQFRSPLIQGERGLERFDLSFDVRGGAG